MVKLLWTTSLLTAAQHSRAIKFVLGIEFLRKYDYGPSWYEIWIWLHCLTPFHACERQDFSL